MDKGWTVKPPHWIGSSKVDLLRFSDEVKRLTGFALFKAQISSKHVDGKAAAARLGIDQPKVSALLRGKLRDFSTERLMHFVTALDHDVVITVCEPQDEAHPSVRVLVGT